MNRRIVFNIWGALAGAALLSSALADSEAETPSTTLGADKMGAAIAATTNKIFQDSRDAVVRVSSEDELGIVAGTGFFADAEGTVYTLTSLVGDGLDVSVTQGGRRHPARLLAKDERSGIALIKVDDIGPTPFLVRGDGRNLQIASPLLAIGYPLDHDVTPSFGIIGGFDRKSKGRYFTTTHIRANIPVQRGQGGSPVLNMNGRVVGILVSGFEQGAGGYILPIRSADKVRSDYVRFGDVRRGWAGVTLQEIPKAQHGSKMAIDVIDPTGPAAAAGFRPGDVVLRVGDTDIHEPEDALDASFFLTAGDAVSVRVARGSEVLDISFTPADHPLERRGSLQAFGGGAAITPAPATANP